jgi:hypothetical protein
MGLDVPFRARVPHWLISRQWVTSYILASFPFLWGPARWFRLVFPRHFLHLTEPQHVARHCSLHMAVCSSPRMLLDWPVKSSSQLKRADRNSIGSHYVFGVVGFVVPPPPIGTVGPCYGGRRPPLFPLRRSTRIKAKGIDSDAYRRPGELGSKFCAEKTVI